MHETLIEQAKAQEKTLQFHQEELRESLEKAFDQRFTRINDEVQNKFRAAAPNTPSKPLARPEVSGWLSGWLVKSTLRGGLTCVDRSTLIETPWAREHRRAFFLL